MAKSVKLKSFIFTFYEEIFDGFSDTSCKKRTFKCTRHKHLVHITGSTTSNLISHLSREDHSEDNKAYMKHKETENNMTPIRTNKRPRFDSPLVSNLANSLKITDFISPKKKFNFKTRLNNRLLIKFLKRRLQLRLRFNYFLNFTITITINLID